MGGRRPTGLGCALVGPWAYVGLRVLAAPASTSPVFVALRLAFPLLGAVRIGPTPPAPAPALLEFLGDDGLRALAPVMLVLVVVLLGKLARPWLLPADRGLGEDAEGGGGEIVVARWPLCWACGCEARFTKPSWVCWGGDENWGGNNAGVVKWDADGFSERGVCRGCTCAAGSPKAKDCWGS